MRENTVLIAICTGRAQAEKAIAELQRLRFDMTKVSVFGRAYMSDEEVASYGRITDLGASAFGGKIALMAGFRAGRG